MSKKRKELHRESSTKSSKSKSSDAPPRSRRAVLLPLPKISTKTPRAPTPPPPHNERSTRLRSLPARDRLSFSIAVEEQQKSKPAKQIEKQDSKFWTYVLELAATPLQASDFEVHATTDTRLRSLPHRNGPPPNSRAKCNPDNKQSSNVAHEQERKEATSPPKQLPPKKQNTKFEREEPAPLPKQLPPGTICISTVLSAADLEKNKALEMPVALRRPSTSHRGRRFSEKENTRPNGVLTNGLSDGVAAHKKANTAAHAHNRNVSAHAHNQALTNASLPSTTHTHPSQTHAPPPAPSRTEEIDREKALERNIDYVVFGDRMFKAWYPSWYPKEIIGEKALSDAKAVGIVVQTLYVCNKCFGYGKEVDEWVKHTQACKKEVPGTRVYMHGAGEAQSEEDCVWSVWEVDGEVDTVSWRCHSSFYCGRKFEWTTR